MSGRWVLLPLALLTAGALTGCAPTPSPSATTERVSIGGTGNEGDSWSAGPAISADGRFVAFHSSASNLVAGDTNGTDDVFLFDRSSDTTTRLSVAGDGTQGDGSSYFPSISADGRFVTYFSAASNLVPGDTNGAFDVFVLDRDSSTTTRASVADGGVQANAGSYGPAISADGRFVTYNSDATNLVAGDSNSARDVFLFDSVAATTTRVSVADGGAQANGSSFEPTISGDGRFVAYRSEASNLVAADTNAADDVFLYDRIATATTRVSVAVGGTQANGGSARPAFSHSGRFLVFDSVASNLVVGDTNAASDVFMVDRDAATLSRVSVASDGTQGELGSDTAAVSADGDLIVFRSDASSLVATDTNGVADVFVVERISAATKRVSTATSAAQANGGSDDPALSADGRFVAFRSEASNLVAADTNGADDVFVRDRGAS